MKFHKMQVWKCQHRSWTAGWQFEADGHGTKAIPFASKPGVQDHPGSLNPVICIFLQLTNVITAKALDYPGLQHEASHENDAKSHHQQDKPASGSG